MWRIIVDEYRNIIALIAITLLLTVPYMEKRSRYGLRMALGIAACLAVVWLYLPIHDFLRACGSEHTAAVTVVSVAWYLLLVCMTAGLAALCHKVNFTELVWVMITAYAVQHIVYVVAVEFVFFGLLDQSRNIWGQVGLSVVTAAVFYSVVYILFIPNIKRRKHLYFKNNWRNALTLLGFFLVFFVSTFVNQSNARQNGINILSMISDFVNCLFVIVVQYVSLRNARMRSEKEMLAVLLENETKQYETFRNAVEYINIKCHDLKHELAALQSTGGMPNSKRFDEITENIAVYESFANTGNSVLDALITDKNLICKNNGISFS